MDNDIKSLIYTKNNIQRASQMKEEKKEFNSFQEQVEDLLTRTTEKIKDSRVLPEYGDFTPVFMFTPNLDKNVDVQKYGLKIYKMPSDIEPDEKMRYVEAAAYLPGGDYKVDNIVMSGYKDEILKQLQDPKFVNDLKEEYKNLTKLAEEE